MFRDAASKKQIVIESRIYLEASHIDQIKMCLSTVVHFETEEVTACPQYLCSPTFKLQQLHKESPKI